MSTQDDKQAGCPFCDIVNGCSSATVVREWEDALAIVPLNPVVSGHVLVLPKAHVETFFSSPDVSAATMRRAAEMLHGVERHHESRDHNVITSAGQAATQSVMHLHVHLVPREHGDGLALPWSSATTEQKQHALGIAALDEAALLLDGPVRVVGVDGSIHSRVTACESFGCASVSRDDTMRVEPTAESVHLGPGSSTC